MKKYILVFLTILFAFTLKAAERNTSFLSSNKVLLASQNKYIISKDYFLKEDNNINIDKETKKAKRLKITGLVFTSLGAAGMLITTPFVVIYSTTAGKNRFAGNLASTIVGVTGYTPSVACLVTGIPMTIVGYKKSKKLKQEALKEF